MSNEKRLIDADALCESFEKAAYKCEHIEDMVFHLDYILDEITGADEVDAVEVVHGRWKYYHKQNIAVCTNCSFERDLDANFGKAVSCPNCGAKMDGGNEDG